MRSHTRYLKEALKLDVNQEKAPSVDRGKGNSLVTA